ncbi:hypothetical protein MSAN_02261600 [Mycena sanguinolenta]|uniref:Uncharacterized protein n=1 Tax=Mycena sanguinolenta TaxID=230812 RepID=A0A8H6XB27_9AGAR|nr:hypothetical protein MSAN_02261600 [Mycena sanguinolenta]
MVLLHSLLFGLLAALLISASPSPRDLLGEVIDALGIGLVTHIDVFITLDTLTDNLVSINFEAQNPLLFELTIDSVSTTAGLNGTVYTSFEHVFSKPVVVPPLGQANSGNITNVLLTQGVTASLAIIPFGVLDLQNVNVNVRAGSIFGIGGVPLIITGLHQTSVPTAYALDLTD